MVCMWVFCVNVFMLLRGYPFKSMGLCDWHKINTPCGFIFLCSKSFSFNEFIHFIVFVYCLFYCYDMVIILCTLLFFLLHFLRVFRRLFLRFALLLVNCCCYQLRQQQQQQLATTVVNAESACKLHHISVHFITTNGKNERGAREWRATYSIYI